MYLSIMSVSYYPHRYYYFNNKKTRLRNDLVGIKNTPHKFDTGYF